MPDQKDNSITTSNYSITPKLSYYGTKTRAKFNGICLKQDKATFNHGMIVNVHLSYEITRHFNISSYPTLENYLFGAVSLTKHADIDQYKYSGYGIGHDRKEIFSFGNGFNTFGVDVSLSTKTDNRKKKYFNFWWRTCKHYNIHGLQKSCIQLIILKITKKIILRLYYNGGSICLFVNGT